MIGYLIPIGIVFVIPIGIVFVIFLSLFSAFISGMKIGDDEMRGRLDAICKHHYPLHVDYEYCMKGKIPTKERK